MIKCILCNQEQNKFIGSIKSDYKFFINLPEKIDVYDCEICDARFTDLRGDIDYNFVFDQTETYASHLDFARKLRRQDDPSWALIGLGHPYYAVFDFLKGKKNLDILDLGCSYGYLTYVLNCMGHKTTGMDVARQPVIFATGLFGESFIMSDIKTLLKTYPNKKFDLIVSVEVIEHVSDPMDFIKDSLACLKPKGSLLLTTPNKDYKQLSEARIEQHKNEIWMMEQPPVHLAIYGKKSFEYIAKENNLDLSFVDFPGLAEIIGSLNLAAILTKK